MSDLTDRLQIEFTRLNDNIDKLESKLDYPHKEINDKRIKELEVGIFTVLEGFTIPDDVRKILETAYYRSKE